MDPKPIIHGPNGELIIREVTPGQVSYIEREFPVENLTPIVNAEVNSKRPIYQIHKWWARRLSSVFRMILLAATAPPSEKSEDLWRKYLTDTSLDGKLILDGTMGGGTTVLESLRLKAKVVGVDINPVAWFVTKKEVEPFDLQKVEESYKQLELTVGEEIRALYRTECLKGHPSEIMYALWHKVVRCRHCQRTINIVTEWLVSEKKVKAIRRVRGRKRKVSKKQLVICCPKCETIFRKSHEIRRFTKCPNPGCKETFNPRKGTSRRGVIECRECGHKETMSDAVQRNAGRLDFRLFCIEYFCEKCKERGYKSPSSKDLRSYRQASEAFRNVSDHLEIPRESIPVSSKEPRPRNHGYDYFHQLFNDRQLLSLSKLLDAIRQIEDKNSREYLLLAFSACLETNNVFCSYETRWQKCGAMFSYPGYRAVDRYAENNVWGTKFGRGTFARSYLKVVRAKKTNGSETNVYGVAPPSARFTRVARNFSELKSERNALVECGNSESLEFVPEHSVDLVATDPPYFDTLNYSRLADFFYVWLRIALKDQYDVFEPHSSARDREVVMVGTTVKKRDQFVDTLSQIFVEYSRVLKQQGLLVFTFHHTKEWAWQDLLKVIQAGGFTIVACHFMRSEGRTGLRKSGHISYDACFVCRKSEEVSKKDDPGAVVKKSNDWVARLSRSGNGLEKSDVYSIVMGNALAYAPSIAENRTQTKALFGQVWSELIKIKKEMRERKAFALKHRGRVGRARGTAWTALAAT